MAALVVGGTTVTGTQTLDATKLTGNIADARITSSSVNQHVDLSNLNASNLTSGTIPNARVPSGAVTQHVSATTSTLGSWTPTATGNVTNGFSYSMGRYYKVGKLVYIVGRWHIPFGANPSANVSGGLGDNVATQLKVTGLPFTSAATGQTTMNALSSHSSIQNRIGTNITCVVFGNTSEIRYFGGGTELDGSYSYAGNQSAPARNYELTVGNAHLNWNDGAGKVGYACFCYYTDTA